MNNILINNFAKVFEMHTKVSTKWQKRGKTRRHALNCSGSTTCRSRRAALCAFLQTAVGFDLINIWKKCKVYNSDSFMSSKKSAIK